MNHSKISVRYAKALFLSALEEQNTEIVLKDLKLILSSFSLEGFKKFIESPVISTHEKRKLFKNVFKNSLNELSWNFIELILTNKRENCLEGIIRYYNTLYKENKGIKEAILSVPVKIDEDYRKKFVVLLEKTYDSRIEIEERIDTELIGGFVLKVEDEQFDASVKTSLAKLRKKLTVNTI